MPGTNPQHTSIITAPNDIRPVPDPTTLTTAAVRREVEALKEIFVVRFEGYDKAITLLQAGADRMPSVGMVDGRVSHFSELMNEKISNVNNLIEKTGELNNTALQAAFAAAKEAVGAAQTASALANTKMEATFTKNFDSVNQLIVTIQDSLTTKVEDLRKVIDDKITDIKDSSIGNITRSEVTSYMSATNERVGTIERTIANYEGRMMMVGLLAAAIPTVVTVLLHFLK